MTLKSFLLQQLIMSEPECSPEERLKQLLKILDSFCSNPSKAEMQQLATEAKRVVNKMQNFLERSLVEQVVELVQTEEWFEADGRMKENFPNGLSIGNVEDILELVNLNGSVEHLVSALMWVQELDMQLQPRACEALYEQLKFQKLANQPQVLLLRKRVSELPEGRVPDKLRTGLDQDFQTIVNQIVNCVQKGDFSLSNKINKISNMVGEVYLNMNEVVTAVVSKFETFTLEDTLLLIQFSVNLPALGHCCIFIDALMKMFEAHKLLTSEQSLQLWSHAKFTMEEETGWKYESKETQKLCTDVVDKLITYKEFYFQHYQKYVENKDEQKILKLHKRNDDLCSILSEFVPWYCKRGDLTTVQNLLTAARATNSNRATQRILTPLQFEMHKFQQMNTFEAFCLFSLVKLNKSQEPEVMASLEELKAKAPTCLRLLLWPDKDENQLQLVNKFYDSPLSIHVDKIVCSNSSPDTNLLCTATVDPITALTTFSLKSGVKLDAAALEDIKTKKPWIGTQWKLKAFDDTYFKIFTHDGEGQFFCTGVSPYTVAKVGL